MKKIFILTVAIVLSLFMLISRNEHIGINLSLNSDVCTFPMETKQTCYLNLGFSSDMNCLNGLAVNVLGSMVYEAKGVAVSGLYILNHTAHDYDGLFLSGGINFTAGVLHGIQIAGIMNSLGEVYGTQVSGMFNLAETLRGIQFSGLINSAGDGAGGMIAPVNVTSGEFKGIQIGLFNYSETYTFQIGLININRFTLGCWEWLSNLLTSITFS
ncbi:hypothetical protein [Bacteroides sp. 41_26]|uniref:LA_2272 family surface repeat-containing protein n=1 Tax=Bacteroides sp. 41_26 TaxID=1896973 RepID=UPI00259C997C|nr:hypothetical protein [Bacteroides sp. 41_26]